MYYPKGIPQGNYIIRLEFLRICILSERNSSEQAYHLTGIPQGEDFIRPEFFRVRMLGDNVLNRGGTDIKCNSPIKQLFDVDLVVS